MIDAQNYIKWVERLRKASDDELMTAQEQIEDAYARKAANSERYPHVGPDGVWLVSTRRYIYEELKRR